MSEHSALTDYILAHSEPESDYLHALYRATNIRLLRPRMMAGHLQGRLLTTFVRMMRPRRILEIGTFTGYSTLCMAEGLEPGAEIYTYEVNDEMEDFTRPWLEGSIFAKQIHFIIGNALDLVPEAGLTYNLVFIDADKRHYIDYYEMALRYLSPGGFIMADNTLWDQHVVDPAYQHDAQTVGIMHFNDYLAADLRVEKFILPLRDGLTIIYKKATEHGNNPAK